jgi:hypothetical protein
MFSNIPYSIQMLCTIFIIVSPYKVGYTLVLVLSAAISAAPAARYCLVSGGFRPQLSTFSYFVAQKYFASLIYFVLFELNNICASFEPIFCFLGSLPWGGGVTLK